MELAPYVELFKPEDIVSVPIGTEVPEYGTPSIIYRDVPFKNLMMFATTEFMTGNKAKFSFDSPEETLLGICMNLELLRPLAEQRRSTQQVQG